MDTCVCMCVYIYIFMAESLCYSLETVTTLFVNQLYPRTKINCLKINKYFKINQLAGTSLVVQ